MSQDETSGLGRNSPVDVDAFMKDLNKRKQEIALADGSDLPYPEPDESGLSAPPSTSTYSQAAAEGFIRLADFIKKKKIEVSPRSYRAVALKKYKAQIKY